MKYLKIGMILVLSIVLFLCERNFLNRTPLDEVTELDYFKTPNDLKTYVNQYYSRSLFSSYNNYGNDFTSDNEINITPNTRLEGTRTVSTSGSIGFGNVRSINYFLTHYQKVKKKNDLDSYKQYLGEAYFFKALIYFKLLKSYGDIQWQDKVLETNSPELYNKRTRRDTVATNIINVLDSAVQYLSGEVERGAGRVNKWMALLIQSRVALYEGTWEKYHEGDPFGVPNPDYDKFLKKASDAALALMKSGKYSIYNTGNPEKDYQDLFSKQSYESNPEVLFWREYDNDLTRGERGFTHDINFRMERPVGHTITKSLADAYLCNDGKPISVSSKFSGYAKLADEKKNRDPRFYQTIATPGAIWKIHENGSTENWSEVYDRLNSSNDYQAPSGYVIMKGYNPHMEFHIQQYGEKGLIIYRYAEALLNYAEAKAELDELTQQDLDQSINMLRDRVGMPHMNIGNITTDPDWNFPSLSPIINEIRRERRIELSLEGFRWDDIARWAAADELIVGQRPKGFKASQITQNPYSVDENGFLDPFKEAIPNGYGFKVGRDYLNSIPESEITLNPNLEQNPGW